KLPLQSPGESGRHHHFPLRPAGAHPERHRANEGHRHGRRKSGRGSRVNGSDCKSKREPSVMIQPLAYIHPQAKIAGNVVIEPFVTIHKDVVIEEGTWIGSNVTIMDGARIGKNCRIFPGAVISGIPQDLKFDGEETTAEIGDNTTIRECVTVNRGTKDKWKTVIGKNCLIQAYSHIAHDCIVGDNCIFSNNSTLAGHITVGDYV